MIGTGGMLRRGELAKLTRQNLYELVWATPGSKLSEDLGVSDVAIAKRCKKLGVPRPSRGYWAKMEAGKKPRKPPLPPTADELFFQTAGKPVGKSKRLPRELAELHPLAVDLLSVINSSKPDSEKRVRISQPTLPSVTVSKALAERTARAFHVVISEVEGRGIPFRRSQSSYDSGFFRKGNDRLHVEFEEELIEKPASGRKSRSTYSWDCLRIPSGKLTLLLKVDRYAQRDTKRLVEREDLSIEIILAQVIEGICQHFIEAQKRHAQEAIEQERRRMEWEEQQKTWQEKEAIRQKEERERKHEQEIAAVIQHRKDDLLKAAEWWRLHEVAAQFISACEERWRNSQSNELTSAQLEWLDWSRNTAKALSPFESGYPEPDNDGAFSPINVQVGGPYPPTHQFSRPPTMPEIPAPIVQQPYQTTNYQPPQPYPFWLKYQRR